MEIYPEDKFLEEYKEINGDHRDLLFNLVQTIVWNLHAIRHENPELQRTGQNYIEKSGLPQLEEIISDTEKILDNLKKLRQIVNEQIPENNPDLDFYDNIS